MLISEQTSKAIDEAVGMYFDLNRSFDRAVSYMTNVYAMPNAANIIHHKLAHLFPLLADKFTEIKDRYNLPSVYPQTHEDGRIYMNLKDMMDELLKECADGYQVIKMVNQVAEENGDFMVHADLIPLMEYHSVVMGQVITLDDKANQMPTEYDEYDRHIDSWGIDGIPELM
jgi:hypothetical protein